MAAAPGPGHLIAQVWRLQGQGHADEPMLKEIGVESYYLDINARRGGVTRQLLRQHVLVQPRDSGNPAAGQRRAIIADGDLQSPEARRILIFDPTSEVTPFGPIGGALQDNYGLLVTEGGRF